MSEFHVVFVVLSILVVVYSDEQGLEWFLGKKEVLKKKTVELLHVLVSVGLAGILITGGLMFLDRSEYLLQQPLFLVKMGFVLALVINAFFIGSISHLATEKSYANLTPGERRRVLLSGTVSIVGWVGAGVCGLLLG